MYKVMLTLRKDFSDNGVKNRLKKMEWFQEIFLQYKVEMIGTKGGAIALNIEEKYI